MTVEARETTKLRYMGAGRIATWRGISIVTRRGIHERYNEKGR